MKKKPHQWPTDGATMKYVDRVNDRLTMRIDKLLSRQRDTAKELAILGRLVRAYISGEEDLEEQG